MSRVQKSSLFSLVLFIFCVFSVSLVSAQGIPGVGTPLTITASSANPKPLETISLTLQSFSVDINQANITWYSNGKSIGKGTGLKSMTVQAGALGSSQTIEVVAVTKEAGEISGSIVIRPADLSLVWQAASYVPAFYKGKALLPFGGSYRVVAMPEIIDANGRKLDPRNLVYSWKKNDTTQKDASGYGKDSFVSSQTSFVRQGDEISVEVTSPTDGFAVSGKVTIVPISAEVRLYENSPLYGTISEKELNRSITLTNEEISIDAEPFFFSVGSKQSSVMSYLWTINGSNVPDFTDMSSITLRRTDETAGSASIGITVGNSAKLLQGANNNLVIRYE